MKHRVDEIAGVLSALLSLALPGAALAGAAFAQEEALAGHSSHGEVFDEGPRQAAFLMGGTGEVHFRVTLADPGLQALFDQGIGQLHGFWYFEAERTFRQIAAQDPDCAMAYWGMAMANVDNPERARGFARVAWLKRGLVSQRERMYVDALAAFHEVAGPEEAGFDEEDEGAEDQQADAGDDASEQDCVEDEEPLLTLEQREAEKQQEELDRKAARERAGELVKALEEIVWEYPDDIEAKAFLVNQLWLNRYAGHAISSRQANEALLQQIFAVNPMHPAHHYRIHLWDDEDTAERVVDTAVRSGPSAPAIAHMWHMGGHIFDRLGRHADAGWQQEASARVDHAQLIRDRLLPDQIHNFAHNNEWLTRSLRHQGRVGEAVDLARNMIELPRHPKYNTLDQRGCSASYGRERLLETLELFEQWDELVALEDTMYLEPSDEATDGALRAFALGKAHAYLGDDAGCERQVAALERMLDASRAKRARELDEAEARAVGEGFEGGDLRAVLDDVLDEHAGELDDVRKKLAALRALRSVLGDASIAGDEREQLLEELDEADFEPGHLARLYLEAAAAAEDDERRGELEERAVELAREAAKDAKGQLQPQANLAFVLDQAGKREEALEVFEQLRPLAARAELELPALARLAPLAASLGLTEDWRTEPVEFAGAAGAGEPVDLAALGPLRWSPPMAPGFALPDAFGEEVALSDYDGRPVVVIFFLGFGCVHCVEQLVAFGPAYEDFAEVGIDIVAIGTDSAEDLREAFDGDPEDTGYPFRVLADPELEAFRVWRAHDDFEREPLHGTFLVDGQGRLRWQDVSYEPFMDHEFLLAEAQRLLGLDALGPAASKPAAADGAVGVLTPNRDQVDAGDAGDAGAARAGSR